MEVVLSIEAPILDEDIVRHASYFDACAHVCHHQCSSSSCSARRRVGTPGSGLRPGFEVRFRFMGVRAIPVRVIWNVHVIDIRHQPRVPSVEPRTRVMFSILHLEFNHFAPRWRWHRTPLSGFCHPLPAVATCFL